jgi:hypothetical protein
MTVAARALYTGRVKLPDVPWVPTTAATPYTILNDAKYNAWPVICRLSDDRLILGHTQGDSHHQDNTGRALLRTSTDEGATWPGGGAFVIYDHASLWASVFGLMETSSGRVIATLFRDDWDDDTTGEAGIVYSDDAGETWSSWIDLPASFTKHAFGTGPAIELSNGDLLVSVEGTNIGQGNLEHSIVTLRSEDDGLTWGDQVTVAAYGVRSYFESKLLRLSSGIIKCVHRTAAEAPGGDHYINESTDDGATWSDPQVIFEGYGAPSTCQLSGGGLVSVTRRNSDAAAIAYTSIDTGDSWGSAIVVDDDTFEMEYGAPVELLDGTVLVVYSSQPSSSITNADIMGAILS